MLMSTGDGTSSIKADWQKVEKIMISWGYTFTIGAMCKSSRVDAHACAFLSYLSALCRVCRGWVFYASPRAPSPEVIQHHAAMFTCD